MIIKQNENLKTYTTIKIGGIAKNFYIPENYDDLRYLLIHNEKYHVLSGGSNVLINDENEFPCIIYMKELNKQMKHVGENTFYIGASVRIQHVIKYVNSYDCGGFEFLYSLPAFFGGILYMNAGRGSDGKCIGDFVDFVDVMGNNGVIKRFSHEECMFKYRKSHFQNDEGIIIGAQIKCKSISKEESTKEIENRILTCQKFQDNSHPNFGSVFSKSSYRIMKIIPYIFNKKGNISYSKKTANWILNMGDGKYDDCISLIRYARSIHKLFNRKCEVEVRIWEE